MTEMKARPPLTAGGLADAADATAEARRLLTQWATAMAPAGGPWNRAAFDWAIAALREGRFVGRLWIGAGGDHAIGVGLGVRGSEAGGRVEVLYLARGFRHLAAVASFLGRLDAPDAFGPLVELPDPPKDHDPGAYGTAARGLGLIPIERVDMRFPAGAPAPSAADDPGVRRRNVGPADLESIARLTVRAYADNPVDVALFRRWKDPLVDARAATKAIFGTSVGEWIRPASFLLEDSEGVVAATLVNDHAGALITQVMVDPKARRRGHAARLLGATVSALRADGRDDIRLVVTRTNRRAERLYERLGFVTDLSTAGATWLHPERLGLSEHDLAGT